MKIVPPELKS